MNSHFKSQNFEEGSKSQHNQKNQGFFFFFNDQGFWKYEMQNRKQALNMFLKMKMKIIGSVRWKKCPEELKITK